MTAISIIIPCYNYGAYIGETLAAIEKEIGGEDEVLIIDDGSTDKTREVVSTCVEDKPAFHYLFQENSGPAAARNTGLDLAKKPYAYVLDADDRPLPGKLDALRKTAAASPNAAMVIGGHMTFDARGKEKIHRVGKLSDDRESNFVAYAIDKNFGIANGGCVLVQTAIARKYHYPETIRLSDDICFYAWILANHSCEIVDETIISIRKHDDSLRHQLKIYEESAHLLPAVLFNPARLPENLFKYKEAFCQHLQLSLFRAQFRAGNKKLARQTYLAAVKEKPSALLEWSYLSKFLRCFP